VCEKEWVVVLDGSDVNEGLSVMLIDNVSVGVLEGVSVTEGVRLSLIV